jgi:hypothetical protein
MPQDAGYKAFLLFCAHQQGSHLWQSGLLGSWISHQVSRWTENVLEGAAWSCETSLLTGRCEQWITRHQPHFLSSSDSWVMTISIYLLLLLLFWNRISLYIPDWPGTHSHPAVSCVSFLNKCLKIAKVYGCYAPGTVISITHKLWHLIFSTHPSIHLSICLSMHPSIYVSHFIYFALWGLNPGPHSKHSTTWATPLALSFLFLFWDRVLLTLPQICASRVGLNWVLVAHTCNHSNSGGRDQEHHGLKPARANSSWNSVSKIPIIKKGWWSGSRWRPWVQAPVPKKKKKKEYRFADEF